MRGPNGLSEPMCFACGFAASPLNRCHLFPIHSTPPLNLSSPFDSLLPNRIWQKRLCAISEAMSCSFPSYLSPHYHVVKARWAHWRMKDHMKEIQAVSPVLVKALLDQPVPCQTAGWWQIDQWAQLRSVKPGSDKKKHPFGPQSYELNKCL